MSIANLYYLYYLLDCFVPYNDEVVNPHIIRLSGLLRSARNDGDQYRHHSFLQGIYPMPGTYNDETRNPVIARPRRLHQTVFRWFDRLTNTSMVRQIRQAH